MAMVPATRVCTECGAVMTEGYCIGGGEAYFCGDSCLTKHMTMEEYLELYDDGEGDSYWTEWEGLEDDGEDDD